jgi:hypothetical protein
MARDRINQWAALDYFNPTESLREARRQGFRDELGGGRTNLPKKTTEVLDATVFTYGISHLFPELVVCFSPSEDQDYDFVLGFGRADPSIYCPVQLKVLVSADVSPVLTPEVLLNGLGKYADASNLVVAVKVDRSGVDPRTFNLPQLRLGGLWFFGQRSGTTDGWYLYGDCLGAPRWLEFDYPS